MISTFVPLGETAEFINGVAFKPSDWTSVGLPIIRIQNLTDADKSYNRTQRSVPPHLYVQPGELLVSWSATLGVFEWAGPECGVLNQHIFRVIPNEERVHNRYLGHVLRVAIQQMQQHLHGATMQHVNRAEFLNTPVFLPSLTKQRQIADILDQAEALRAKRRATIALLDTLTQSIFFDMFGDPIVNPKRLPMITLGDVVTSVSDGPHVSPEYADTGVPFLSTRHVRAGEISWSDLKYLKQVDADMQWKKCKPRRDDILYTKGGTTGLAAIVRTDDPFAIWVHVALVRPDRSKVEPIWLESMLNSPFCYYQSQRFTHGIANRDLGLTRMVKIKMVLPPLDDQQTFLRRREVIDRSRSVQTRHLTQLDALFASLQYRAFRGEL